MILDTIIARKKDEVTALRRQGIQPQGPVEPPRGFIQALTAASGLAIIAEAKKASPSKGILQPDFDPVRIARTYQQGGAQAMSVLTDVDFFQGSLAYIPLVRAAVPLPVLRKDFLIDPLQIEEAHAVGADAILLIAAILTTEQLRDYRQQAESYGMDVLVEIHNEQELDAALTSGSRIVGINNRNLNDFSLSLETTFRLKKLIPADIAVVSESGIATIEDIRRLKASGIKAALIGEMLMRAEGPCRLLQELLAA